MFIRNCHYICKGRKKKWGGMFHNMQNIILWTLSNAWNSGTQTVNYYRPHTKYDGEVIFSVCLSVCSLGEGRGIPVSGPKVPSWRRDTPVSGPRSLRGGGEVPQSLVPGPFGGRGCPSQNCNTPPRTAILPPPPPRWGQFMPQAVRFLRFPAPGLSCCVRVLSMIIHHDRKDQSP